MADCSLGSCSGFEYVPVNPVMPRGVPAEGAGFCDDRKGEIFALGPTEMMPMGPVPLDAQGQISGQCPPLPNACGFGCCAGGVTEGNIVAGGGLLRAEYVTGILLDSFTLRISLYALIFILPMRKLRLRGLKGWTKSCHSEGVGCDWYPDCKPSSHSTASLELVLPASVPAPEGEAAGTGPPQGAGLWNECGAEAWGQGTLPVTTLTIP